MSTSKFFISNRIAHQGSDLLVKEGNIALGPAEFLLPDSCFKEITYTQENGGHHVVDTLTTPDGIKIEADNIVVKAEITEDGIVSRAIFNNAPVLTRTPTEIEQIRATRKEKIAQEEKIAARTKIEHQKRCAEIYPTLPKIVQKKVKPDNYTDVLMARDAMEIAKVCKTPEGVEKFSKLSYKEQEKLVPCINELGHANFSFEAPLGSASYLAKISVQQENPSFLRRLFTGGNGK